MKLTKFSTIALANSTRILAPAMIRYTIRPRMFRNCRNYTMAYSRPPPPKIPKPLENGYTSGDLVKFRIDYEKYYDHNSGWSRLDKIWATMGGVGAFIGSIIGYHESKNSKKNETELFNKTMGPIIGSILGGIGGIVPPVGAWVAWSYYDHKSSKSYRNSGVCD